jgi:hypothetical protein
VRIGERGSSVRVVAGNNVWSIVMLNASENAALEAFRTYRVPSGKMLCFHTPQLAKHVASLRQLAKKGLVIEEQFAGGYSLTRAGVGAMQRLA